MLDKVLNLLVYAVVLAMLAAYAAAAIGVTSTSTGLEFPVCGTYAC